MISRVEVKLEYILERESSYWPILILNWNQTDAQGMISGPQLKSFFIRSLSLKFPYLLFYPGLRAAAF